MGAGQVSGTGPSEVVERRKDQARGRPGKAVKEGKGKADGYIACLTAQSNIRDRLLPTALGLGQILADSPKNKSRAHTRLCLSSVKTISVLPGQR